MAGRLKLRTHLGLVLILFALFALWIRQGMRNGLFAESEANVKNLRLNNDPLHPLFASFTGVKLLDAPLKNQVTFFWTSVGPNADPIQRLFVVDFLVSVLPVAVAMYVEGLRASNWVSALAFPAFWLLLTQNFSFAFTMPIYGFVAAYRNRRSRPTPLASHQVKVLAPALFFGYIIPTILLFNPFQFLSAHTHQWVVAAWQPFYIIVSLLYIIIVQFTPRQSNQAKDLHSAWTHLRQMYRYAGLMSAAIHVAFVVYLVYHQSFIKTYFVSLNRKDDLVYNTHVLLMVDYALGWAGAMLWVWAAVDQDTLNTKARLLLLFSAGPGAAFAVAMRNREKDICGVGAKAMKAVQKD